MIVERLITNKLVYGVGINDANYRVVSGRGEGLHKKCPFYLRWQSMLRRCYSESLHKKYPSYVGCFVCTEWVYFSNFKTWMETQAWEGKTLDKDILFVGNKEYGPRTCVFVDHSVNNFLTDNSANRGKWPIGVYLNKELNKFTARCRDVIEHKQITLGYFTTPEEAHAQWLAYKLKQARILASQQTDSRVAQALISRYENFIIT